MDCVCGMEFGRIYGRNNFHGYIGNFDRVEVNSAFEWACGVEGHAFPGGCEGRISGIGVVLPSEDKCTCCLKTLSEPVVVTAKPTERH